MLQQYHTKLKGTLALTDSYLTEKALQKEKGLYKFGNYTLFTLIFKKFTFMIITFKLFVIFAPNIQIRLDFSNHCNDIK